LTLTSRKCWTRAGIGETDFIGVTESQFTQQIPHCRGHHAAAAGFGLVRDDDGIERAGRIPQAVEDLAFDGVFERRGVDEIQARLVFDARIAVDDLGVGEGLHGVGADT